MYRCMYMYIYVYTYICIHNHKTKHYFPIMTAIYTYSVLGSPLLFNCTMMRVEGKFTLEHKLIILQYAPVLYGF